MPHKEFGRLFGSEGIFQNPPQPETGLRPSDPGAFEATMAGPGGFMGGGALGTVRGVIKNMPERIKAAANINPGPKTGGAIDLKKLIEDITRPLQEESKRVFQSNFKKARTEFIRKLNSLPEQSPVRKALLRIARKNFDVRVAGDVFENPKADFGFEVVSRKNPKISFEIDEVMQGGFVVFGTGMKGGRRFPTLEDAFDFVDSVID